MRKNDLTGKRFGKLTVIKELPERENSRIVWECECDCGNKIKAKGIYLTTGETQSCGCLKKDKEISNLRDRYNPDSLKIAKIRVDNKSGVKGVSYDKTNKKWRADIRVNGKQLKLGAWKDKQTAIAARKIAEEKYYKPISEDDK